MSAPDNANSTVNRSSAEKAPIDIEKLAPKPAHDENAVQRGGDHIPHSDEEYNVTFKTWIVVWVGQTVGIQDQLLVTNDDV